MFALLTPKKSEFVIVILLAKALVNLRASASLLHGQKASCGSQDGCLFSQTRRFITMALGGITLSTGMRNTLGSLNGLQQSIQTSNLRLSTGKKVNSAIDDAATFFLSEGLADRAKAFSIVKDNIGVGIKTIETATKGLGQIKTLLESAQGQLRNAQSSIGTNARATSALSFNSGSDLVAAGTGTATQFDVGDAIVISTYNGQGGAGANGTLTITLSATVTVQYVIDQINGSATLNPIGQAPRVRASLSNGTSGNLVIEQVETNSSTTLASGAGNAVGLQINLTNVGVTQDLRSVFNFTGIAGGSMDVTSTTNSVRTYGTTNATREAAYTALATTLEQIGQLIKDTSYNGTNLLNGDTLTTYFNADNTTFLRTQGQTVSNSYLGMTSDGTKGTPVTGSSFDVTSATGNRRLQSDTEIKSALAGLSTALSRTNALNQTLAANVNIIKSRESFTSDYVKLLDAGADDLVSADINQEGANLLSLQTRQQLAVQALALAGQSDQAVLRLF
jgi:flagellin-like hook-associated protein FlgL